MIGLVLGHVTQNFWPFIVVGLLIGSSLIVRILWSRITKPILSGIINKLSVSVSQLTIDDKRQEVNLNLNITNNQHHKLKVKPLKGGIARLGSEVVSQDIKPTDYVSDKLIQGHTIQDFIQARFDILPTCMTELHQKENSKNEAYWKFSFTWLIISFWGEKLWEPTDIEFIGKPRIGNR